MKKTKCILFIIVWAFIVTVGILTAAAVVTVDPARGIVEDDIWTDGNEALEEYAYSMAIIGDTQIVTERYPKYLPKMYEWIAENKEEKKIEFVIGLGDITNNSTTREWSTATEAIKKLNGVLPYSLVRGNHDSVSTYNTYITQEVFGGSISGSYDGTMMNTYCKFTVGEVKYLILNLDLIASDAHLEWANNVVAQHPDYNVVVATHIYMYDSGIRYDITHTQKYSCQNDSQDVWDKLISKHENIIMVLCGHTSTDRVAVRSSYGEKGNKIVQVVVMPASVDSAYNGAGIVGMFYFSEDGRDVQVEFYSTVKDKYYLASNNSVEFKLDVVDVDGPLENDENVEDNTDQAGVGVKDNNDVLIVLLVGVSLISVILAVGFVISVNEKKGRE